jgi:hypothetical protein
MSEQETLRLVAEVVDKYSAPMKQMMDQLNKLGQAAKGVHEDGKKRTNEHTKAFRDLHDQLNKVKDTTTDVLRPAFNALGITVLSVAGSIAAVSEAVKNFGEYGQKLEYAHRASGLLTSSVRGLSEANERFGMSAEDTIRSLEQFGGHMNELARKNPNYINEFKKYPRLWNELGSALMNGHLTRQQQLDKAMNYVSTIRDVDQKKRVLALLGLPENWAYLSEKEMAEMRKRAEDFNNRFPFSAKAAEDAKKAWDDLITTFHGLRDEMGGEFAPGFSKGLKEFNELINSESFKEFKGYVDAVGKSLSGWNIGSFKSDAQDLKAIMDAISATVHGVEGMWAKIAEIWKRGFGSGTGTGAPGSQSDQKQQDNVKEGTRKGLEEFYNTLKQQNNDGGYTPMAYHPPGSSGGGGGGTPRFGSAEYPNLGAGAPGGGGGLSGGSVPKSSQGTGNGALGPDAMYSMNPGPQNDSALASDREKRFRDEVTRNPGLLDRMAQISLGENKGKKANQEVIETIFNRASARGTSLAQAMKEYTGRGSDGYYPGTTFSGGARAMGNAKLRAMAEEHIRKAWGGSNVSGYATDNSSSWLAEKEKRSGAFTWHNDDSAESFFSPGKSGGGRASRGSYLKWLHGLDGQRKDSDAELLSKGMKTMDNRDFKGNANVTVDFRNMPKGVAVAGKADGMFKQVTLNRGRQMFDSDKMGLG